MSALPISRRSTACIGPWCLTNCPIMSLSLSGACTARYRPSASWSLAGGAKICPRKVLSVSLRQICRTPRFSRSVSPPVTMFRITKKPSRRYCSTMALVTAGMFVMLSAHAPRANLQD
jgi:hypothetical protein